MSYQININLGDWSDDGHGKTSNNYFSCSHGLKEVVKAYNQGCRGLGFKLHEKVCSNYGDTEISKEHYDKFVSLGFAGKIEDLSYIQEEELVELFIFTVQLGNSMIKFVPTENNVKEVFGYGGICHHRGLGYGLFS